MVTIRAEIPADLQAIREVNETAFETPAEARLVDRLRQRGKLLVSLVAEEAGRVVGHIAFSRARLSAAPGTFGLGLGPMAVIPSCQNRGIGSRLAVQGLSQCVRLGAHFVVVLGHPHFYPRFGFLPAARFRLACKWPVPEGVFMALETRPGSLADAGGLVSYEAEFDDV